MPRPAPPRIRHQAVSFVSPRPTARALGGHAIQRSAIHDGVVHFGVLHLGAIVLASAILFGLPRDSSAEPTTGQVVPTTARKAPAESREPEASSPIDLDLYARMLERHTHVSADIVGTRVDYRALRRAPAWKTLVRQVESATPSRLDRPGRLAFWINAYNILTLDLVLTHYPVASIRDIGTFFSPVWDIEVVTIEGRRLSLGEIEHEILRKLDEPRIHAAIVCASTSCPPLSRKPFSAASLDADLSRAMQHWLSNREKGIAIDRRSKTVRLSKVFDWFEEDFESRGGVLAAIAPYLDASDAEWLKRNDANLRVRYFDYDWSLNDVAESARE